ncbi:MAG TPA: uracil-DNA glycosylase [Solirubrobacteraceae bacterium]|nr:uracil-DNA glycosylase [Solirubrobacteraceae bacterium]
MRSAAERREQLKEVYERALGCTACPLHQTRTTVVFGAGNADADLMFIGEGPGANEDRQGLPFVGRAGKLLDTLLQEIGLERASVFIANVVKCRPPGNRDPHPEEIEACHPFLRAQVELIEPRVICTLGNFSTKLLRGDPTGITRLHGRAEVRTIGARTIRLLPLFHPAAALYTPSSLQTLREDFSRIPELLAAPLPPQPDAPLTASPTAEAPSEARCETPSGGPATGASPESPRHARSDAQPEPELVPESEIVTEQLGLF